MGGVQNYFKNKWFFPSNIRYSLLEVISKGKIDFKANFSHGLKVYERNLQTIINICAKNNIEFRRGNAGGGNQLRQPYIKDIVKNINLKNFKNVEHVHFFGYYIGNYPSLKSEKIIKITNFLNSLDL